MKWRQALGAAGLVLSATSTTLGAVGSTGLFPQAARPPETDLSTRLRLPDGRTISLDFVRFRPTAGVSEAAIPFLCGVVLRHNTTELQALVTIGTGPTRFWTCDGLSEDGVATTRDGHWMIGLVYNTSTPVRHSTTVVLLVPEPAGRFHVDDTMAGRSDVTTLDALRRTLAKAAPRA
jgi:hypothetical protein